MTTADHAAFPPGSSFLMLPRRTARAARAGLALYDAVEPRQRVLVAATGLALRMAGARVLPRATAAVDGAWWRGWLADVAEPVVGPVADVAFRVPPNGRTCALLLDASGSPVGFVKVVATEGSAFQHEVDRRLRSSLEFAGAEAACRLPALLGAGRYAEVAYRFHAPLPWGAHRALRSGSPQVEAVIDAFRRALASAPRPPGAPDDHVVCHADFTPRNLRRAADGTIWLFDWDNARWGPRLADELHYWCAERVWRVGKAGAADARAVLARLRQRGSDAEIAAAAAWPDAPTRTYRAEERSLWRDVGALVGVAPNTRHDGPMRGTP